MDSRRRRGPRDEAARDPSKNRQTANRHHRLLERRQRGSLFSLCRGSRSRGGPRAETCPSHSSLPELQHLLSEYADHQAPIVFLLGEKDDLTPASECVAYATYLRERGANTETIVYQDRKSTRLNSSHMSISYAVF